MSKPIFSPGFARGLEREGISMAELESDVIRVRAQALANRQATRKTFTGMAKEVARKTAQDDIDTQTIATKRFVSRVTGVPEPAVNKGLWNPARDVLAPAIAAGVSKELAPWRKENATEFIPEISLSAAMRASNMNIDRAKEVGQALNDYPQEISINGLTYETRVAWVDYDQVGPQEARRNVSTKRVVRASRKKTYRRQSRTVDSSWVEPDAINSALKKAAFRNIRISLVLPETTSPELKEVQPKAEPAPTPEAKPDKQTEGTIDIIAKPLRSEKVQQVLEYFQAKEYRGKPIAGAESFAQRLTELTEGREVPFALINCIMFDLEANGRDYPAFTALRGRGLSIVAFWQKSIAEDLDQLSRLGSVKPTILVPNSELTDGKLWKFSQSVAGRESLADTLQADLRTQNKLLVDQYGAEVILWDEFSKREGLKAPEVYTDEQERRILAQPDLLKKVQGQIKRARTYLEGYIGAPAVKAISDRTIFDHIIRYDAMYAGEGAALAALMAINPNPEERNVITWNQIGADNQLAAPTPFDIDQFYKWRSAETKARGIGRFARK